MDAELPPIRIDVEARRAWHGSQLLDLPRRQFDVLVYLAKRAGSVVTRNDLLAAFWGPNYVGSGKTLDMHISYLRHHLGDDPTEPRYISTVRCVGFRLEAGTAEILQSQAVPDDPGTRVVTVKGGEVLIIGNVGDVPAWVHATAVALRDQLGLAGVLLLPGDIDTATLPRGAL
ncbi:winged helix-turn-helix domain-containing protein [Nonomuraea sp. NPDC050404]|uniref:winged helix-turn-helix domain-containing protein n=1 Tax=Nonomuraea sp. NPDC050404 TaxID=3155783 RepID=UPI003403163A